MNTNMTILCQISQKSDAFWVARMITSQNKGRSAKICGYLCPKCHQNKFFFQYFVLLFGAFRSEALQRDCPPIFRTFWQLGMHLFNGQSQKAPPSHLRDAQDMFSCSIHQECIAHTSRNCFDFSLVLPILFPWIEIQEKYCSIHQQHARKCDAFNPPPPGAFPP